MKNIVLMMCIILLSLSGCKEVAQTTTTPITTEVETTTESIQNYNYTVNSNEVVLDDVEDNTIYQKVTYDLLSIEGNAPKNLTYIIENLNDEYETEAKTFYTDSKEEVRDIISQRNTEYYEEEIGYYTYSLNTEIINSTKDLFSVEEECSVYTLGAHPNTIITAKNYDLNRGKMIQLNDIISDKIQFTSTLISLVEKEYKAEDLFDEYKDTIKEMVENNSLQFVIHDDNIEIIFNQYDIAAYAVGQIRIICNNELLS